MLFFIQNGIKNKLKKKIKNRKMPIDVYDYAHNHTFAYKLDFYCDCNIDQKLNYFFIVNPITPLCERRQYISEEIRNCIQNTRNAFAILETKQITCISSRIFAYEEYVNHSVFPAYETKWILINIWRGKEY